MSIADPVHESQQTSKPRTHSIDDLADELDLDSLPIFNPRIIPVGYDEDDNEDELDPDYNFYDRINHINSYLDIAGFNAIVPGTISSNLKSLMHINIHSLPEKIDMLSANLSQLRNTFSVIAVTETWTDLTNENLVDLDGYDKLIKSRSHSSGGGVALYVNKMLNVSIKMRPDLSGDECFDVESLFIQVKQNDLHQKDVIVGVIYRPSGKDCKKFFVFLNNLLHKLDSERRPVYLLGDFNINLLASATCGYAQQFIDILFSHGFYHRIDRPTRITGDSATLIDNIFTNVLADNTCSGPLLLGLSDHLPIYVTLPYPDSRPTHDADEHKFIFKRFYLQDKLLQFKHALANVDWSQQFVSDDVNINFSSFTRIITQLHDSHFPITKIKLPVKGFYKPWITGAIKNSIKKKNNLYKLSLSHRTPDSIARYKAYKNKLTTLLRIAEKNHYANKLAAVNGNNGKTWKVLNQILMRTSTKNSIKSLNCEGIEINSQQAIVNKLNDHFVEIGPTLADAISRPLIEVPSTVIPQSIFLSPTTENEILNIISDLKASSAKGYDQIPISLIKFCKQEFAPILSYLINDSFTAGIFPDGAKIAKVVPIYKNGDKKLLNNYRPISILSSFSKIIEKAMFNRLISFLERHSILHPNQFGFRKKLSTNSAILQLVDKLNKALDENKVTIGVFLDLSKAFDTIDHHILVTKLENYGVRGTVNHWFKSYLQNRSQYTILENTHSNSRQISCGVPQGSILGPLLFLIYINELNMITDSVETIMFADDTNLFISGKDLSVLESNLNTLLNKVSEWLRYNLLSLNLAKTVCIVFAKKKLRPLQLLIAGTPIEQVLETKFLGVIISANLTWKSHIDTVCTKMAKNIGIIAKVRHILPQWQVRQLYLTLVQPYLTYCCLVWASDVRTGILSRIHKLQKKYCRLILFAHFQAHSPPLFRALNILTIYDLYVYQAKIYMFKITHNLLPRGFLNLITNADIHSHNTRLSCKLHTEYCRTNSYKLTIRHNGVKLWNETPTEYKGLPLGAFKKKMKAMLLDSYC